MLRTVTPAKRNIVMIEKALALERLELLSKK
jgi:hypothetical protein